MAETPDRDAFQWHYTLTAPLLCYRCPKLTCRVYEMDDHSAFVPWCGCVAP